MNCTNQEFVDRLTIVDPSYYLTADWAYPGYMFALPLSHRQAFNLATNLADSMSHSTHVWHNGAVIKDTTGLFIPLSPPALTGQPVYLQPNGSMSHTPSTSRTPFIGGGGSWVDFVPSAGQNISPPKTPKCECGAHKVGSNKHSNWCEIKESNE